MLAACPRSFDTYPDLALRGAAAERRLPAIYESSDFVDAGGLMSYGGQVGELALQHRLPTDRGIQWNIRRRGYL